MTPDRSHNTADRDLRQQLIDAGIALLREGGMPALTLRQTAARAGVSHAAPAHHFEGIAGLMTAMAAQVFDGFTAALNAGRAKADRSAYGQLLGICLGYLDFARDHAGLFQLIFLSAQIDRSDPALLRASDAAYGVLRECCLPFSCTDVPDPGLETAVWSMVHGYALLDFANPENPKRRIVDIPPFETLLRRCLAGQETPC